ncbi:MAG TPA: glycosyltransferase family 4 protein [Gemmatimonadaceae bacterium]|nr:glycosyltransferase family 4 protein [Gemmatimonadaceae bacterium]
MKHLLTIGHSYVVGLNRRLADEMAREAGDRWRVTAAAPESYAGDLGRITLERTGEDASEVVPLPVHLDRSPHLMMYGRLAPLMKRQWDVVHCWEEPYVMAAAQIAAAAPRPAAFVFSTFQNIAKSYPPPFNWIERRVLRRSSGWIAFGQTTRDVQQGRPGYSTIPSRVIPPGVDTRAFTPDGEGRAQVRAARGWDDAVPVIGFAGRFVPEKGLEVLIAALRRMETPWRALFVGGGPELAQVEALSAAFPRRVSIARGVTHAEMPAFYNAMDVLCAPSQTTLRWREQFGRMLSEAMACGVPVVASRSGEIPHVVADAAVLLPEDDVEAWASTLTRVLQDASARRELADRGLRRARTEFAWPIVARRHLDFFDELTGTR